MRCVKGERAAGPATGADHRLADRLARPGCRDGARHAEAGRVHAPADGEQLIAGSGGLRAVFGIRHDHHLRRDGRSLDPCDRTQSDLRRCGGHALAGLHGQTGGARERRAERAGQRSGGKRPLPDVHPRWKDAWKRPFPKTPVTGRLREKERESVLRSRPGSGSRVNPRQLTASPNPPFSGCSKMIRAAILERGSARSLRSNGGYRFHLDKVLWPG
jgi:hypothetical protein